MQGVDAVWIDTQANVVTSASILSTVIDTLGLQSDPEFGGSRDTTLRALVKAIKVERADQTYVLDISVRSGSAERSARIAQELAEAFVANQVEVKQAAVREASNLINRQLDDLRAKGALGPGEARSLSPQPWNPDRQRPLGGRGHLTPAQ